MITIRPEQQQAFQDQQNQRFAHQVAVFLQDHFPDAKTVPLDQLTAAIVPQLAVAQDYGLWSEWQISTFITTAWILGAAFHQQFPAARLVLNADDCTPHEKAKWLETWTQTLLERLES